MMMWNTSEGGPCLIRPSGSDSADSPDTEHRTEECVDGYNKDWTPIISTSTDGCENAWADENNAIHGAAYKSPRAECVGPFSAVDQTDTTEIANRHATGWSNMFASPWEISSYWNFTTR